MIFPKISKFQNFKIFILAVSISFLGAIPLTSYAQQSWKHLGILREIEDNKFCYHADNGLLYCGASSPLSVSGTQVGVSVSAIDASLTLDIDGNVGATQYCDEDGNNCFTASSSLGGAIAIDDLTDGIYDGSSVFLGNGAGAVDDGTNNYNTSVGRNTLAANTSGAANTGLGYFALNSNIIGQNNNAFGYFALGANTANANNAFGYQSLMNNTSGYSNTAMGGGSLFNNLTGRGNSAVGESALLNSTGHDNNAFGYFAGDNLTAGNRNIAIGSSVDFPNPTGSDQLNIGNTIYGDLANDKIGIGVEVPQAALDVSGTIKIADSGETCDAAHEGGLKFDTATKRFYKCTED